MYIMNRDRQRLDTSLNRLSDSAWVSVRALPNRLKPVKPFTNFRERETRERVRVREKYTDKERERERDYTKGERITRELHKGERDGGFQTSLETSF